MNKLPYKIRIFEWSTQQKSPFTVDDIMNALKSEYGNERQFTVNRTEEYVQSMLGACMYDASDIDLDDKGNLTVKYIVTDFGKSRIKHIPKHF